MKKSKFYKSASKGLKFFKFLGTNASTIIALIALYISIKTLNNANKQFKQNNKNSDILFNTQLKFTKELNDCLIYQLQSIQEITNKQLSIINDQLSVSEKILSDQLLSGRPKIIIEESILKESKIGTMIITSLLKNVGERYAYNLNYRPFIVDTKINAIYSSNKRFSIVIEPSSSEIASYEPSGILIDKYSIFYCIDIEYLDKRINKIFRQTFYFRYAKTSDGDFFVKCTVNESNMLRELINDNLNKKHSKLLYE